MRWIFGREVIELLTVILIKLWGLGLGLSCSEIMRYDMMYFELAMDTNMAQGKYRGKQY